MVPLCHPGLGFPASEAGRGQSFLRQQGGRVSCGPAGSRPSEAVSAEAVMWGERAGGRPAGLGLRHAI